jgi:uncharacterized surface protein with fasciclin (FAS1) repeats
MKNYVKTLTIATSAALAIVPGAAWAGSAPKGNLVAAAVSSKDHQTLVAAVKAAGLVDTLAGSGPFTVFAPTDAAFARLPAGTVNTLLQPANRDQLRAVLTYHVVPGAVTSAKLIEAIRMGQGTATLKTVQGGTITARLSGDSVVILDAAGGTATVTKADLIQSNGVIHVTDAVSLPM